MLDPARLDEGEGIENTLRQYNAKHHQSCRLLISNSRLQIAQKRASTSVPARAAKTFDDYAKEEILSGVESYSVKYQRIDIVFAVYKQDSLKTEARSERGKGVRRRVTSMSKTPQELEERLARQRQQDRTFPFS